MTTWTPARRWSPGWMTTFSTGGTGPARTATAGGPGDPPAAGRRPVAAAGAAAPAAEGQGPVRGPAEAARQPGTAREAGQDGSHADGQVRGGSRGYRGHSHAEPDVLRALDGGRGPREDRPGDRRGCHLDAGAGAEALP